jgi:hypothetical protein
LKRKLSENSLSQYPIVDGLLVVFRNRKFANQLKNGSKSIISNNKGKGNPSVKKPQPAIIRIIMSCDRLVDVQLHSRCRARVEQCALYFHVFTV